MAKGDAELVRKLKALVYEHGNEATSDSELLGEVRELLAPPNGPVCTYCGHPVVFQLNGRVWYHVKTGKPHPCIEPNLPGSWNFEH